VSQASTHAARPPPAAVQFAVNATGVLRLLAADVKNNKPVQLLLSATGAARVTIDGTVVAALSITGKRHVRCSAVLLSGRGGCTEWGQKVSANTSRL